MKMIRMKINQALSILLRRGRHVKSIVLRRGPDVKSDYTLEFQFRGNKIIVNF